MEEKKYEFVEGEFSWCAGRDTKGDKVVHIMKNSTHLGCFLIHPAAGLVFSPAKDVCFVEETLLRFSVWIREYYSLIESPEYAESLAEFDSRRKAREEEKKE